MASEALPGSQRDDGRAVRARESDRPAASGRRLGDRDSVLATALARVARWSLRVLLVAAVLVVIGYVLSQFWVIVRPVLLALLLATVLWPPVELLRRKLPPALAVLLVLVVAALALTGLGLCLVPQVLAQLPALADSRAWFTLSGFLTAQAAVALVDAAGIGIGLVVLDVPLALPLAILIFFGAFIPFVGAFVTGALAAVVALVSNGLGPALIVVALILVVQALEGNVLEPLLMSRALDLHPAVIVLAVTAGGALFGIFGAFLAVPVVAVLSVLFGYAREQLNQVAAASAAVD